MNSADIRFSFFNAPRPTHKSALFMIEPKNIASKICRVPRRMISRPNKFDDYEHQDSVFRVNIIISCNPTQELL